MLNFQVMGEKLMKNLIAAVGILFVGLSLSSIIFLFLLPLTALFFMWLWNDVMAILHLLHTMSYWQSVKICFLIYVVKALFSFTVTTSNKD